MTPVASLCFKALDLPVDVLDLCGEVAFEALDLHEDALVTFLSPLRFALRAEPVEDGVLVRGRLEAEVQRVCDRCLEPARILLKVDPACYHYEQVVGAQVDLTDAVREDILLAFPQTWVCRADCRGLCPRCGCNRNESTCGCPAEEPDEGDEDDDTWGALDDLVVRDDS